MPLSLLSQSCAITRSPSTKCHIRKAVFQSALGVDIISGIMSGISTLLLPTGIFTSRLFSPLPSVWIMPAWVF